MGEKTEKFERPETMNEDLFDVLVKAFDAEEVAEACEALRDKKVGIRKLARVPRRDGLVDQGAMLTAGVPLWLVSGLASALDPKSAPAAPGPSAPAAPQVITVSLTDNDPKRLAPRAFLEHLGAHHAADPSLVAWADEQHPLASRLGVVATATGIDVEATCGPDGLWSQKRDWRGATWADKPVMTAAEALAGNAVEEFDPVHRDTPLQRGFNPQTRVQWAKATRAERGFVVWVAQTHPALLRRDDGARVAKAIAAGTVAEDEDYGPLLARYEEAAVRDTDLKRRCEAIPYRIAAPPSPPSGGAARRPFGGDGGGAGGLEGAAVTDLRAFRTLLQRFYPTREIVCRVLTDAVGGDNLGRFDLSGSPEAIWFNVVEECRKSGWVQDLVRVATSEYPKNPELRALVAPPAAGRIDWQKLAGADQQEFHAALLSAYTSRLALARLVRFTFDENLDAITTAPNLSGDVFSLIEWARARGWARRLFDAALGSNETNASLLRLAARA